MWAMTYTLIMHSTNPKYIVVYFTQKRQNQRSRFVNSTPLNLVIFFLFCVAHNTMYLRLRFCILVMDVDLLSRVIAVHPQSSVQSDL
jgi:hypothetical protein